MDLAYVEAGEGTPVVLLHAFPLTSDVWAAQREGLADTCRVITPDQRGFGGSTQLPLHGVDPSLDVVADDLATLLDRLELDRVVLGGLSMGGYVALAFLRHHAHRVAGLALLDTKASADLPEAHANRLRVAAVAEVERHTRPLVEQLAARWLGPASSPELAAALEAAVRAAPPDGVAWAQRAMAARREAFDVLAALDIPVTVMVGAEDVITPVGEAEAMAKVLRDGRLIVLDGIGHLTPLEAPDAVTAALRDLVTSA